MLHARQAGESGLTYAGRRLRVGGDRCVTEDGRIIEPYHALEYPTRARILAPLRIADHHVLGRCSSWRLRA